MRRIFTLPLFLLSLLLFTANDLAAQCMSYPVPFEQRISQSAYVVQGKVIEKHCYIDASTGNVNTLNKFRVAAWLKNYRAEEYVYVITLGGIYGDKAMQVHPALQLDMDHEYLLMLEANNMKIDDKDLRRQKPQALQLLNYADAQGSLTNENNLYHDLYYRTPKSEEAVFAEISSLTGQTATRPSGEAFIPRAVRRPPPPDPDAVITTFSPNPTNAGTIAPADFITISGSGFGAAAGTVFYANANDGGATFTATGVASDNVAWADGSIQNKPASAAGTGPINVNGAMTSGSNLNITYSHLTLNSNFSGFASSTRQRYYLRNQNGAGGYTYTYNTAFQANAPARIAFERSLLSWRCNTYINLNRSAVTSAINTAALDGVSIVTFDGTLPAGVLGRATSRFSGSAITGVCDLANTVWWATELDMQFYPDPPVAGFPWEYGPAAPAFTEYDFETVASHELGHHHGLGHVIAPGDMMHFALANGSTARVVGANNITGGIAKLAYSIAATCFNPGASGTPMTLLSAGTCALPLDLAEFRGERKNAVANQLYWNTAREVNTHGFYLQRSADGAAFEDLAFIKGAGTTESPRSYNYTDAKAGPSAWYYRLRLVDLDLREAFSNTVFIKEDANTTAKVWAAEPGDKVLVYLKQGSNATLRIFNAGGQQLLQKQINTSSSETAVAHLAKGIYYYQLHFNGKKFSGKLLLGSQ